VRFQHFLCFKKLFLIYRDGQSSRLFSYNSWVFLVGLAELVDFSRIIFV